ncbi:DUF2062 domain-containing protein [Moraxella sp. FZLJ2107]|uniref:DUF2062 domain-containing protein n=1 Tax=unclassified Moraxella TaxID=2685852 RepID=UPI00209C0F02|nr:MULTISPECIES: DUF2062 domain-containing protein [unclassified Moraxella]USZ14466.1 DUF2062 domain-containing protein [Moraxella sp. FZFQ2102]UTO05139.1 DUF2062 domain-containing protein [Moraxella sp. FZLJ2107]UTO21874.1 DUF2062 domain-containing protein [Moraxella sp. FZLJ2109]
MPKNKIKAWLPTPEKLRENRLIAMFAPFLADPRLWQMNRGSLNRAVYVGVLAAFFPLPGQMPLAIIGALLVRANVPMAVALTWITNPLTGIPVFWAAYSLGAWLLGEPMIGIRSIGIILSDLTLWVTTSDAINPFTHHKIFSWQTMVVGLVLSAIITSIVLGVAFRIFWHYRTVRDWQARHGYNAKAPRFSKQKGHKAREKARAEQEKVQAQKSAKSSDDFSI